MRRGQTGEGNLKKGVLFGQAEKVRFKSLLAAHQAVQENRFPGVLVHGPTVGMGVTKIGQFSVAAAALDAVGVGTAYIRIQDW